MLEEKGGKMYGRHKASIDNDEAKNDEVAYIDNKWANFNIEEAISILKTTNTIEEKEK